jgi:hypothetical protein
MPILARANQNNCKATPWAKDARKRERAADQPPLPGCETSCWAGIRYMVAANRVKARNQAGTPWSALIGDRGERQSRKAAMNVLQTVWAVYIALQATALPLRHVHQNRSSTSPRRA